MQNILFESKIIRKIEMTKRLLDKGIDINIISEVTGLSIEELKRIGSCHKFD